jgi:hypothetical protein
MGSRSKSWNRPDSKAVPQLLCPHKDREVWFSLGENHENLFCFGYTYCETALEAKAVQPRPAGMGHNLPIDLQGKSQGIASCLRIHLGWRAAADGMQEG